MDLRFAKGDTSHLPRVFSAAGWRECRGCKYVWETRVASWACAAGIAVGLFLMLFAAVYLVKAEGSALVIALTLFGLFVGCAIVWAYFSAWRRQQDPPNKAPTGQSGKGAAKDRASGRQMGTDFRFDTDLTPDQVGQRLLRLGEADTWPRVRELRLVPSQAGCTVTGRLGLGLRAEWRVDGRRATGSRVTYRVQPRRAAKAVAVLAVLALGLLGVLVMTHSGSRASSNQLLLGLVGILALDVAAYVVLLRAVVGAAKAARQLVVPEGNRDVPAAVDASSRTLEPPRRPE